MLKIVKFSLLIFYVFFVYSDIVKAKDYKFYFAVPFDNANYKNILNSICNTEDVNFICNIVNTDNSINSLELIKNNGATFAIVRYDVAFEHLNYENNIIYSKIDDFMLYIKSNNLNLKDLLFWTDSNDEGEEEVGNDKQVKLKSKTDNEKYKLKIVTPLFQEYLFIFSKKISNYFEIKELRWANVLVSDRNNDSYVTLKYLTRLLGYSIENMYLDKQNNIDLQLQALCDNKIDVVVIITSLNNPLIKKYLNKCGFKIGYINDTNLSVLNIRTSYYLPVLIDPEIFSIDSSAPLDLNLEKTLVKDRFVKTISIANIVMANEDIEEGVVYEFLTYYYKTYLNITLNNKDIPKLIELDEIYLDKKNSARLETSNNDKNFLRYFVNKNIRYMHKGAIRFFKEVGIIN